MAATTGAASMHVASSMSLAALRDAYAQGMQVVDLVQTLLPRLSASDEAHVWTHRLSAQSLLAQAEQLDRQGAQGKSLFGIPFAVKDNLHVAGLPTSNGCAANLELATSTAPVVSRLLEAGALFLGKTNMDQFAMGLVGTRSPFGLCRNPFNSAYIAGGSSSGSALALSLGLASFSLGTDTAGSGRVPAALNDLVGLKPTRGRVSSRGLIPSCRSLDCISLFAHNLADAWELLTHIEGQDAEDPYSRLACGIPPTPAAASWVLGIPLAWQLECFGDEEARMLFEATLETLAELPEVRLQPVDISPFLAAGQLLYEGPWIAERYASVGHVYETAPSKILPVISKLLDKAHDFSAQDGFAAMDQLQTLRSHAAHVWQNVHALLLPTVPTVYNLVQVQAEPITCNARLGHYTHFVNLLDCAALAVPVGHWSSSVPYGVSLIGPAWSEARLCQLAAAIGYTGSRTSASTPSFYLDRQEQLLCVCGGHMRGLALNHQLLALGGRFLEEARSAAHYRMLLLDAEDPPRPGLIRAQGDGMPQAVELWALPVEALGRLLSQLPKALALGPVELADGRWVGGFVCQAAPTPVHPDITAYGGWRAYLAAQTP